MAGKRERVRRGEDGCSRMMGERRRAEERRGEKKKSSWSEGGASPVT